MPDRTPSPADQTKRTTSAARRRATAAVPRLVGPPDRGADGLSAAQRRALDRMAAGDTAKAAAAAAGVSRQTVHNWLGGDPAFRAAYHAWQADAVETARARLLALADAAVTTVAAAVARGDTKTALAVLGRQGLLAPPTPGPTDPELVARQDRHRRTAANQAMTTAECGVPAEIFAPDPAPTGPPAARAADPNAFDPNAFDLAQLDAALCRPTDDIPPRLPGTRR